MEGFFLKKGLLCFSITMVLILLSSVVMAEKVDLVILHTNDTHSRLEEGSYAGMGFAKISTLVENFRSESENVLVLDAGDTFHGQTIANLVRGESVVKIMNKIGYDAMVPGNHDFNYGQERLLELEEMADFTILATNVKKGDNSLLDAYLIKDVAGVRVAIFGLATPETTYKTHPNNVKGLDFVDPVAIARESVSELDGKADIIIALTHLGISEGSEYTSKRIAEEVDGIDLIVDGHSHNDLEEGLMVNDTLIVMAGEYDKNLGKVTLTLEDGQLINKSAELVSKEAANEVVEDQEIINLLAEIKDGIEEITSVVVGNTSVILDGERENVRSKETNLGNLITDAMLDAVDVDCAITNGGGIRSSIAAGEITKGDVITVLPFGNFLVVKELSGSVILNAIEHAIAAYPAKEGKFPQVAGLNFIFDPSRPAGERVLEIEIAGETVDYNKNYLLATNDFMAAGGDGYTMFQESAIVQEAGSLEEVVMDYISKRGIVNPKIEGRILTVEEVDGFFKYTVQQGDTLSEIAALFDVSVDEISESSKIDDSDWIVVGQELLIPQN